MNEINDFIKRRGNSLCKCPAMLGYNEKTVKDKPPETGSSSVLILDSQSLELGETNF